MELLTKWERTKLMQGNSIFLVPSVGVKSLFNMVFAHIEGSMPDNLYEF